jgi:hypothetical protein
VGPDYDCGHIPPISKGQDQWEDVCVPAQLAVFPSSSDVLSSLATQLVWLCDGGGFYFFCMVRLYSIPAMGNNTLYLRCLRQHNTRFRSWSREQASTGPDGTVSCLILSLGTNPPVPSQYMLSTWWFHVQNTNTFLNQNMLSSFRMH